MRRKSMFKIASATMRHVLLQVATLFVTALLAVSASAQTLITYYHNDALGSPVAATDQDGNLLWRENYAPYGQKIDNPKEAYDTHIGYTGKPDEGKTGLTYMNARYYDPLVGRFMGVDPVGPLTGGREHINRYGYAYNNPYRYIDPTGMQPFGSHSLGTYLGMRLSGKTNEEGGKAMTTVAETQLGIVDEAASYTAVGTVKDVVEVADKILNEESAESQVGGMAAGEVASEVVEKALEVKFKKVDGFIEGAKAVAGKLAGDSTEKQLEKDNEADTEAAEGGDKKEMESQ
ncbi:RHS domain-containing protein [Hahella sp. CR1]|uniref:RHS repeat domain-containing protein n=1 Tax=Hahella sp. CR1 TaxID=2992807 RepID=UPI0024423FDA|nr:RHS repeat-associated core domain-containing protein [Hahella sp. CR1]MDG9671097.1 RHS domain-containing protein [Hahella sp. CR1]